MSQESLKKAMDRAGNILSYHPLSAAQLYDRLVEKGESREDSAAVVAKLLEIGYLNDLEYGKLLVRQGIGKGYGPARLRQELRKRKLDPDTVELAMEDYQTDSDRLIGYIRQQLRGDTVPDRAAIKRVTDGLVRKGFSWDEIDSALRHYLEETAEEL